MALQDTLDQLNDFDINDVDFTRMGVWPIAGKAFFCFVLLGIVIGASYFLFVKDLNVQHERVFKEEGTLKKSFEAKVFQAANLVAYRGQMAEMEKSFGALIRQLPGDTEVPGLLEDIDEKGITSGLQITSIDLQPEKTAEFYIELPISINVTGTYHDMGSFVSGVAEMPRIVTLHEYQIKKSKGGDLLDMTILAKTYRYKDQGEE
jgi:type IV pilus assembly protein PilO